MEAKAEATYEACVLAVFKDKVTKIQWGVVLCWN